jgi:hypothetical protein
MAELELWFEREPDAVLDKTVFRHEGKTSTTDREADSSPIQWRAGVQAHMFVFLHWASMGRTEHEDIGQAVRGILAGRDSPANSVKESLTKHLNWRARILGGFPITGLVEVRQQNYRPWLFLNEEVLGASDIHVFVDGAPVEDSAELKDLADTIERRWHASREPRDLGPDDWDRALLLTETERKELLALAAASLGVGPESLPARIGIVIGQARRVQLAYCLRGAVERTVFSLDTLLSEIEKEPENLSQTRQNGIDLVKSYIDSTRLAYAEVPLWAPLLEVAEAARAAIQAFLKRINHVGRWEEAHVVTLESHESLSQHALKLNELYAEAATRLGSIR